jgi:hypothetical protein
MASAGLVEAIVTTNYDCCFEVALRECGNPLHITVRSADLPTAGTRLLFKIHGSAAPSAADTMVFSLEHEGSLELWKRDALCRSISGRPLLAIGYSGLDFDVCPEIGAARPREVFWNFQTREDAADSPGLQRVLDAGVSVTLLIGDMNELLMKLLGRATNALSSTAQPPIRDDLRRVFSVDELLAWRASILNKMGHARLALGTVSEIHASGISKHMATELRAQALFHRGLYVHSARLFDKAAGTAPTSRDGVVALLHACDAARCAGRLRWARSLLSRAESGMHSLGSSECDVRGLATLKAIMLERDSSILSGQRLWSAGRIRLRQRLEPLLRQGADWAAKSGQHFDFQQFELWRRRLGLPQSVTHPPGSSSPEDPRVGYRHLGFPVAVAMDLCDRARTGQATADDVSTMWRLMRTFGCCPQSWKLGAVLLRMRKLLTAREVALLIKDFCRCEYTPRQRIAQIARMLFSSST